MSDPQLWMFTIYDGPADYPARFVVRRFAVNMGRVEPVPDENPWMVCGSLEEARESLPPWVDVRLPRQEGDQGSIVETWC